MTDRGVNDNQAQNIHIRMFFTGKSIIVSFYGLSERLKSCKPTSNANDTFPNSLQKSIIDVSSKVSVSAMQPCTRSFIIIPLPPNQNL